MACKVNFWKRQGMAASCGPQNPTTPATTELQKKLADMKAERSKLDTIWSQPVPQLAESQSDRDPLLLTQKPAFFQASKKNEQTYATWG